MAEARPPASITGSVLLALGASNRQLACNLVNKNEIFLQSAAFFAATVHTRQYRIGGALFFSERWASSLSPFGRMLEGKRAVHAGFPNRTASLRDRMDDASAVHTATA
jgi:hypothetical protein